MHYYKLISLFVLFSVAISLQSQGSNQSIIVNDFKFDIIELHRLNNVAEFNLKVTNLLEDDRVLGTSYYNIYFYDDQGNLYSANDICLLNMCEKDRKTITKLEKKARSRVKGTLPYDIPMNFSFRITNLKNGTKSLKRAVIQCLSYFGVDERNRKKHKQFEVVFENLPLDEKSDVKNPLIRDLAQSSLELLGSYQRNDSVYIEFYAKNHLEENLEVEYSKVSFLSEGQEYNSSSFFQNELKNHASTRQTYQPGEGSKFQVLFFTQSKILKRINRVNLEANRYKLNWNDIEVIQQNKENNKIITLDLIKSNKLSKEEYLSTHITLDNIYFESGSSNLLESSNNQLDVLKNILLANPDLKVEVNGHTDNIGDDKFNYILSQKRADAVKYYLIENDILPIKISSTGHGRTKPISTNTSDSGRSLNRRVEIILTE